MFSFLSSAKSPRVSWARLLLLPALFGFGVRGALAQGTVIFNTHIAATVSAHVYLPLPADPGLVQIGNGPDDYPASTTDWTGWTPVSGSAFSAQLFVAQGADVLVSSLTPAFPPTTFRTGSSAGFVVPTTATLTGVPFGTPVATIQMRVWDNRGGTIADWATAVAQPPGAFEMAGVSAPINVGPISGPGGLNADLAGLQSFNLTYVPEPSAFALAMAGVSLLGVAWLVKWRNGRCSPRP